MKKTLLALLLILCMAFSLVSCSSTPYDYNLDDYISFQDGQNAYKTITITQKSINQYINQSHYSVLDSLTTASGDETAAISTSTLINKGAAQVGDVVTVTYTGIITGEETANDLCSKATATDVTIGTDLAGVPAGFDDALIGLTAGAEKNDLVLTYPSDYETEALRDKEVTFTVKVSKIARPTYAPSNPTDTTAPIVMVGDKITLDYSGILDGELTAFDGGTATDATLWIGSDNFIEGFESQLVGAPLGVELKLKMTFPEDYSDSTKAGKAVTFTITVSSISRPQSAMTIEQVNTNKGTSYATMDEWDAALTQEYKEQMAKTELLKKVTIINFPKEETTRYAENIVAYYEYMAAIYGYTLTDYVGMMGYSDAEDFIKSQVIPQAQSQVKEEMMLLKVAQWEGIELSDAEYAAYLEANFADNGYASAKEFEKEAGEENIRLQALCDKITTHLASLAVIA